MYFSCLTDSRRFQGFAAAVDGAFFRGLVFSLINGEREPMAQTMASDLLRVICYNQNQALEGLLTGDACADENALR